MYKNEINEIEKTEKILEKLKTNANYEQTMLIAKCEKHLKNIKKKLNNEDSMQSTYKSWDPGRQLTLDESHYFYK